MSRKHYLEALGIAVYRQRALQSTESYKVFRLYLDGHSLSAYLFYQPELEVPEAAALLEKMLSAAGFEAELLDNLPEDGTVVLVMGDLQICDQQINILHPALLLQQPALKREAWEKLKSVVKQLRS